ncbi:hypothetical protein G7Y89_g4549 [Cudoniella acicularis]|uniref:Uncharacterized protein n=1 Tax=Cudoniella acicularis TaxID=354080 RepID=A0A8H4W4V4_9HELO|nr:hypothetical protein G7Y89_g4549 [Cudoniella acicularis]
MIEHFQITELPPSEHTLKTHCNISIKLTNGDTYHHFQLHLADPLSPPPATQNTSGTEDNSNPYTKNLTSQLAKNVGLRSYIESASTLIFEILIKKSDCFIGGIYWEALEDWSSWPTFPSHSHTHHHSHSQETKNKQILVIRTTDTETDIPHHSSLAKFTASTSHGGNRNILLFLSKLDDVDRGVDEIVKTQVDALKGEERPTVERCKMWEWDAMKLLLETRANKLGERGGVLDLVHLDADLKITGTIEGEGEGEDARVLLEFIDKTSQLHTIDGSVLAATLSKSPPHTVVVTSPFSATTAHGPQANLADLLIEAGVKVMVGMSGSISSAAVGLFVKEFYKQLFEGAGAERAAVGARAALRKRADGTEEWMIPVVYCCCAIDLIEGLLAEGGAANGASCKRH